MMESPAGSEPAKPLRKVTPAGVMVMTAKQMTEDREAWLRLRRFREPHGYCIGSSDVPAILNVPGSGSPVQVWHAKVHGTEQRDNPNMMWGRLHEDTIGRHWRNVNRSAVRSIGLVASVDRPWAQASLDRAVLTCPLNGASGICALEIKTRGAFGSRRFHKELPDDILGQICWQLLVSGYEHIHYAILVGGNDYRQGVVRREEEAVTVDYVFREVAQFRDTFLAGGFVPWRIPYRWYEGERWAGREVEPPWEVDRHASRLIELDSMLHPERLGVREIDDVGEVVALAAARAQVNALSREHDQAKARVLRQADGARWVTVATDGGPELAYEFVPREQTKVDRDILKEKYPEAYADPDVVTHTTSWQINIADAFKVKTPKPEEKS